MIPSPFDALKDFACVSRSDSAAARCWSHPRPVSGGEEFITYAQARPGQILFSSAAPAAARTSPRALPLRRRIKAARRLQGHAGGAARGPSRERALLLVGLGSALASIKEGRVSAWR